MLQDRRVMCLPGRLAKIPQGTSLQAWVRAQYTEKDHVDRYLENVRAKCPYLKQGGVCYTLMQAAAKNGKLPSSGLEGFCMFLDACHCCFFL